MTEIHVGSGTVWTQPLGGGPWTHLGYTTEGATINATFEDEPEFDLEALRRGIGGRTMTIAFTITRRQVRHWQWMFVRPRRNRRRNPLHAVRDRLRRHHRERVARSVKSCDTLAS